MPFICKSCENKQSFTQTASGRCNYYEDQRIDQDGEVEDTYDSDYDSYDENERTNLKCNECRSENVENVSLNEWESWEGPKPETWQERFPKR